MTPTAEFLGVLQPSRRRDLETIVRRFSAAGVGRWFFRPSPCPRAAVSRECRIVLAETMSILPISLANLVRKGFRESCDTEIFVRTELI